MDFRPLGTALLATPPGKLVVFHDVEVARLILPAGKEIFEYRGRGSWIAQCLEGKVEVTALGKTQLLEAGHFLYLPKSEPHTLKGIENASLLLTTILPHA